MTFIQKMNLCLHCPAFEQILPLFQYALRYAVAFRCKTEPPLVPEELDGVKLQWPELELEEKNPKASVLVTEALLDAISQDLMVQWTFAEIDDNADMLLPKRKRERLQEVAESALKKHLLPEISSRSRAQVINDSITAFINPDYFPKDSFQWEIVCFLQISILL